VLSSVKILSFTFIWQLFEQRNTHCAVTHQAVPGVDRTTHPCESDSRLSVFHFLSMHLCYI